ncbi:MAG: hypothetical protein ACUVUR_04865 [bacterium]
MTGLHFNYKDIFRALRIGFSAKKVGMGMLGLLFGLAGYSILSYLAHLSAGNDWISIWEVYRLLPFPRPDLPFPWYAWLVYGLGVLWLLMVNLVTGSAIAKVTFEQLRGNEFYEAGEGFRFALKNCGAVLFSPLLILAFIAILVIAGIILSAIGSIPHFGPIAVGLFSIPAFLVSLFIVYLLIVLFFTLLLGPSIVGAMSNDTFDTLFEVFSCVNEQPARLVWYTFLIGLLAKVGSFLLGIGSSLAGRVASLILSAFMRDTYQELLTGASFIFKVSIPNWGFFAPLHKMLLIEANLYGLPQIYSFTSWANPNWSLYIGSVLLSVCAYAAGLMVLSYGLSVWFSANVLNIAVLIKKKDDKNILEVPEEEAEVVEPEKPDEKGSSATN